MRQDWKPSDPNSMRTLQARVNNCPSFACFACLLPTSIFDQHQISRSASPHIARKKTARPSAIHLLTRVWSGN